MASRGSSSHKDGYYRSLVGRNHWTMGRHRKCDILIPDRSVSQNHALLFTSNKNDFYFCDIGSLNGTLINNVRSTEPVLLQHGDCLTLGEVDIEFQYPSSAALSNTSRNVLMVQSANFQGKIWQALLIAQGISVEWKAANIEIPYFIDHLCSDTNPLPDLLLIDIEKISPNPYDFCRWCNKQQPSLKIILTCGIRTEVISAERSWAKHQGALDLLPGFSESDLMSNIVHMVSNLNCVLDALNKDPIENPAMVSMLLELSELKI